MIASFRQPLVAADFRFAAAVDAQRRFDFRCRHAAAMLFVATPAYATLLRYALLALFAAMAMLRLLRCCYRFLIFISRRCQSH